MTSNFIISILGFLDTFLMINKNIVIECFLIHFSFYTSIKKKFKDIQLLICVLF